jgi:hypothetical protein
VEVGPGATVRRNVTLTLGAKVPAKRNVFVLRVEEEGRVEPGDAFVAVDVAERE